MDNIQLTLESSTTSLSLNSDSIYLNPEIDGLAGLPEIRTTSGVNAGYNGGWTSAQFYDARLITIRGVISNSDISVVEDRRKALVGLLGQGRKEELTLHFVTAGGNSYVLNCRTISCEMALSGLARKQEFLIQLRADDPLIYDDGALATEAIVNVRRALGGFQIDFGLPLYIGGGVNETLVENGNETVYPVINLYGPLHSPTIINQTTNQQMQVLTDLDYTLTWVNPVEVTGDYILVTNETDKESPLSSVELLGNTTQDGTPTPDTPVAVQTTTGEQEVVITGKNLFDYTQWNSPSTVSGITFTREADGTITASGTPSADYVVKVSQNITPLLEDGATYTMSATQGSNLFYIQVRGTKVGGGYDYYGTNSLSAKSFTVDMATHTTYVVSMQTGTKANWGTSSRTISQKFQLEKSSSASDFEPYQSQSYEVNLGKNLFDGETVNGWLNASGVLQSSTSDRTSTNYIAVQPNTTYTLHGTNSTYLKFTQFDGSKTAVSQQTTTSATTLTATTGASTAYVRIGWGNASSASNVQLEIGQATDYAPYFTPIELCKLGDYQDYIYKSGNDWYVRKEVGKRTYDGSNDEGWQRHQTIGLYINLVSGLDRTVGKANLATFADTTQYSSFWNMQENECGISGIGNFGVKTSAYDVASWRTLLASTPLTLYYALTTPTDTQITNQALIDQLDALASSTLFVGVNNIALVPSGGAQGELSIDYFSVYTEDRDIVVIDSQARTITKNGADIYYLKADGSEFPTLAPGENTLYLTSEQTSDEGYAEIKFKQGYLSI